MAHEFSNALQPTEITCPDCGGVMHVKQDVESYPALQCQVGHWRYLDEAIMGKEDQLENVLWLAIALLKQLQLLYRQFAAEDSQDPNGIVRVQARIEQANAQAELLRQMLQQTLPVGPEARP